MLGKTLLLAASATAFVAPKQAARTAPLRSISTLDDVGVVEEFPGFFVRRLLFCLPFSPHLRAS